jgi:hypothetical protein
MRRSIRTGAVAAAAVVLMGAVPAAADTTVVVSADGDGGWAFNADPANVTPYEFSTDEASIGSGSLYVPPITNTVNGNGDKFIGALPLGVEVADVDGLSFDYLLAAGNANEIYMNVYTNIAGSSTFYECRFDYVATSGDASSFSTLAVDGATVPTAKGDRVDAFTCPATLGGMPAGSTVSFIAINLGDRNANDTGSSAYFDNVVVDLSDGTTTYDFDPAPVLPTSKDDCKQGGFAAFGFSNQGLCIASVVSNKG